MEGKLVVTKKSKSGPTTYRVLVGVTSFAVSQAAKCFCDEDAADGIDVVVEKGKDGQPSKVTIPGKDEVPPQAGGRSRAPAGGGKPSGDRRREGKPGGHRGGSQGGAEPKGMPPRRDAKAPYNFVTAAAPLQFSEESGPRYSGVLHCVGEALTPLLVCGPQERRGGRQERSFFTVAGRPVIPGSSLKGLLRVGVEALARGSMAGLVSEKRIAFRDVGTLNSEYAQRFKKANSQQRLRAGFLVEEGVDRTIVPCKFVRVKLPHLQLGTREGMTAADITGEALKKSKDLQAWFTVGSSTDPDGVQIAERASFGHKEKNVGRFVPTGWMPKKAKGYIFHDRDHAVVEIKDGVWQDFQDQLTRPQEDLLKILRKEKLEVPVFYLEEEGRVTAIGLSRYFRVCTKHSPKDLVGDATVGDLPRRIFGGVRPARRGRVRVTAAAFEGNPTLTRFPSEGALVAGNPAPSAVAMYLVQDSPDSLYRGDYQVPRNEGLVSYDADTSVLRGRKFYWHRQSPPAPQPPKDNLDVQAIYHPLASGSTFSFTVAFERLTTVELGSVLESLDLPAGHAHKLGLGKSFGLGSVRIKLDWEASRIDDVHERYGSLRGRLANMLRTTRGTDAVKTMAVQAKASFCAAVEQLAGGEQGGFDTLEHVKQFRCLTDWENPPSPDEIQYMPLSKADPSYATKAILESPEKVKRSRQEKS